MPQAAWLKQQKLSIAVRVLEAASLGSGMASVGSLRALGRRPSHGFWELASFGISWNFFLPYHVFAFHVVFLCMHVCVYAYGMVEHLPRTPQ